MPGGDATYQVAGAYLDMNGLLMAKGAGCGSFCLRVRATIAQINAGLTLLPALPGLKYRLNMVAAIAIGGNASAVTSVDVKGTQAAGAVVLAAFAQANLTRSTYLAPGITGCTILADGASFAQNDAGTAVTVIKNGSDIATSTHVDILLSYAIEV